MNLAHRQLWEITLTGLLVLAARDARANVLYSINVSTASVAGTSGFVDFQFNPGADSQAAFIELLSFASDGSLDGVPQTSGAVSGVLPGTVEIDNTDGFNDYFQPFIFGQAFSLVLDLDGPAITSPDGLSISGNTFGLGLFDINQNPILTTDPDGFAALVQVDLDGTTSAQTFAADSNGSTPAATLGTVPEPDAMPFGIGLVLILAQRRKRKRDKLP